MHGYDNASSVDITGCRPDLTITTRQTLNTAMSAFSDSYTNLTANLGTDRDKASHGEYARPSSSQDGQYMIAYEYAWLPRKVVDQVGRDAFRKWRSWQADPQQISAIENVEKRLQIRGTLESAYIDARLRGTSYVYISIKGDEDRPHEPLNVDAVKRGDLLRVSHVSKDEVAVGDIDIDPISPGYGKPRYYQTASADLLNIHPSRMVVFYGDKRPSNFLRGVQANSVLAAAMPAIKRHDSIVANVASLVFESRVDVITVPGLAGLLSDPDTETQVLSRFNLMAKMKSNNGLVMLNGSENPDTPSEKWEQKNTTFATLPDIIEKSQDEVSAAARTPRAILFGVSSGGLGSTGDLDLTGYYDHVNMLQTNDIEPEISVLDECLIRSALGSRPENIWYSWSSLWQVSDKDRHESGREIADKWNKIVSAGIIPAEAVTQAIINELTESGVGGGIEQSYEAWISGGGMDDLGTDVGEGADGTDHS